MEEDAEEEAVVLEVDVVDHQEAGVQQHQAQQLRPTLLRLGKTLLVKVASH